MCYIFHITEYILFLFICRLLSLKNARYSFNYMHVVPLDYFLEPHYSFSDNKRAPTTKFY